MSGNSREPIPLPRCQRSSGDPRQELPTDQQFHATNAAPGKYQVRSVIASHCVSRLLAAELIGDYPPIGETQTPHQTLAVQALRNTRCVEEIAHGRSSPLGLSISSNRTQYAASGGGCLRFRAGRRSNAAAG